MNCRLATKLDTVLKVSVQIEVLNKSEIRFPECQIQALMTKSLHLPCSVAAAIDTYLQSYNLQRQASTAFELLCTF